MQLQKDSWASTLLSATIAVTFATVGLAASLLYPGATPLLTTGVLLGSLAATATAFTLVALRLRRLELENEGLIEEISQELDRVHDKFEIFGEALAEPRSIEPDVVSRDAPARRIAVK